MTTMVFRGVELSRRQAYGIVGAFALTLLLAFAALDALAPAGRRLAKVGGEDPVAYFGIAHSLLFDGDFDLTNEYARKPPSGRMWTPVQEATGLPGSPWGIGYSLLEIPFLAAGTAVDKLAGNPADGYSQFAILFYCFGSPVFAGLGLIALLSAVLRVPEYVGRERTDVSLALAAVFAIFFGTSAGYYAFSQTSHASTFLFSSLFLALWLKARESDRMLDWVFVGLAGGFLSICRWQELVFLAGPAVYELFAGNPFKRSAAWWAARAASASMVAVCWIPQIVQWKLTYDKYFTIPQGSGFLTFPPQWVPNVLLSSRNGWFTWTPLVVLCCTGLLIGLYRKARLFAPWIVVMIFEVMVVGSMRTWHGHESFGARYLLSMAPILALGLWQFSDSLGRSNRRLLSGAVLVCVLFTCAFAVQFRFDWVPKDETLTAGELLWDKFRLPAVRLRNQGRAEGLAALSRGDAAGAVTALERVRRLGEDRQVEEALARALRAAGDTTGAKAAELRYRAIQDSRLP